MHRETKRKGKGGGGGKDRDRHINSETETEADKQGERDRRRRTDRKIHRQTEGNRRNRRTDRRWENETPKHLTVAAKNIPGPEAEETTKRPKCSFSGTAQADTLNLSALIDFNLPRPKTFVKMFFLPFYLTTPQRPTQQGARTSPRGENETKCGKAWRRRARGILIFSPRPLGDV